MYRESNLKCIKTLDKELETLKVEKDGVDGKLSGLLKESKNLNNLIESQRSKKVKDGVGYNDVPPPASDLYLSLKKDLSWTGLLEFADDTVTDYSRPSPTVEIKFVKAERPTTNKAETVKKPTKKGKKGTSRSQNGTSMRPPHRPADHRPHGAPMRPPNRPVGHRPHGTFIFKKTFSRDYLRIDDYLDTRVQRLERELKARAPIHKEDRGRSRPVMA
nr:hypothetical protein [Tanacetum cinerariifolium]